MKIRIALDQGIGRHRKEQLIKMGYEVVAIAGHAEKDEKWLNRAFSRGALFAVSPDLDIPRLIETEKYPMIWINYPHDTDAHRDNLPAYIDKTIKFKLSFFASLAQPKKQEKKSWFGSFFSFIK